MLGNLAVGSSRHRALMFKLLADSADIKCQVRKGVSSDGWDDVAVAMVQLSDGKVSVSSQHGVCSQCYVTIVMRAHSCRRMLACMGYAVNSMILSLHCRSTLLT